MHMIHKIINKLDNQSIDPRIRYFNLLEGVILVCSETCVVSIAVSFTFRIFLDPSIIVVRCNLSNYHLFGPSIASFSSRLKASSERDFITTDLATEAQMEKQRDRKKHIGGWKEKEGATEVVKRRRKKKRVCSLTAIVNRARFSLRIMSLHVIA